MELAIKASAAPDQYRHSCVPFDGTTKTKTALSYLTSRRDLCIQAHLQGEAKHINEF